MSLRASAAMNVRNRPAIRRTAIDDMKTTLALAALLTLSSTARADHAPRTVLPDGVVDLRTTEGAAHLNAQWRYSDTVIREIEHRDVGSGLKATGPKNHTFDFTPDARATDFDDSRSV